MSMYYSDKETFFVQLVRRGKVAGQHSYFPTSGPAGFKVLNYPRNYSKHFCLGFKELTTVFRKTRGSSVLDSPGSIGIDRGDFVLDSKDCVCGAATIPEDWKQRELRC